MKNYPLQLSFKLVAINPQIAVADASGAPVLYIKQSFLALKESVKVYGDPDQKQELYQIKASKIIDWSARYDVTRSSDGKTLGSVRRKGLKSLWKATYEIFDAAGTRIGVIHEENPWLKVLDSFLADIPFAGMLVNPSYLVDFGEKPVLRIQKKPAFFEGKFSLERLDVIDPDAEELLLNSVAMVLLLERMRG